MVNLASEAQAVGFGALLVGGALAAFSIGNRSGRLAGGATADRFGITISGIAVITADLVAAAVMALWPGSASLFLLAALAAGLGLGGSAGLVSRLAREASSEAPNTPSV